MRSHPNIEKSGFRIGAYIGHAHGCWTIVRINSACGKWQASHQNCRFPLLFADTLGAMSDKLAVVAAKPVIGGPADRLRHHVTGAIERGEKVAIVEQPIPGKGE